MLFFTVLLFVITLILLLKGRLFHEDVIKVGEEEIAKSSSGNINKKVSEEVGIAAIKVLSVYVTIIVIQIAYLLNAIHIDPIKYPTIALLIWYAVGFVKMSVKKKNKLNDEKSVIKYKRNLYRKYSLSGFLFNLAWVAYLVYMFHILVF